jgi:phosphatidylserine/phosphatidylglycerophosphate/cardiolipin synthase-like enzyme
MAKAPRALFNHSTLQPLNFTLRLFLQFSVFSFLLSALAAQDISGLLCPLNKAAAPSVVPDIVQDIVFAPGCEAAEIAAINSAKARVRVQIYTFTSVKIATALIAAKARGVDVQVIMDSKAAKGSNAKVVEMLNAANVPLKLDAQHAIAHIKMTIIDGSSVLTGSFNYTVQAEHRNAEMLIIINGADAAEKCTAEWNLHNAHAK